MSTPFRQAPSQAAVLDAVAARMDWGIAALQRLLAVDSVAPDEEACQEVLAGILSAEGLPAQLLPLDPQLPDVEGYTDAGLPLARRPNLVVALGGQGAGRSLVLNSHIDIVPWADGLGRWRHHPLSGAVENGRLYGRGAMDAKGQVMTAVLATVALCDLGYVPDGRLVLESVVGEEPDGNGTLSLCSQGWLADAAIILEGTENHVAYGHRGVAGLRFLVEGQPGHGAVKGSGSNAIIAAARLVEALDASLATWQSPADAVYGPPSMNVGRVAGGDSIFTIPQRCEVECGLRYAPGTFDDVMGQVRKQLERLSSTWPSRFVQVPQPDLFLHHDAMETLPGTQFVQELLACVREVSPDRALATCPGGTDARHFANRYRVPAVVFGPGPLSLAHAVDEYLPLDQWLVAAQALALFIVRWCS